LNAPNGTVHGELVRQFKVDSQPEGCVADDQRQRLFLGEEDVGVWAVDARADQSATLSSVIKVGPQLQADVEGLALYQSAAHDY
ncbi:phytase, partial [Pseudomonas sp. MPR-AND1A]|uniref:phytase n=1 Tax=Pseudomonas sp. MPR-AND1A TaxID=2070600 RepID=UPI000CC89C26